MLLHVVAVLRAVLFMKECEERGANRGARNSELHVVVLFVLRNVRKLNVVTDEKFESIQSAHAGIHTRQGSTRRGGIGMVLKIRPIMNCTRVAVRGYALTLKISQKQVARRSLDI